MCDAAVDIEMLAYVQRVLLLNATQGERLNSNLIL
jgi:hypothetical protein